MKKRIKIIRQTYDKNFEESINDFIEDKKVISINIIQETYKNYSLDYRLIGLIFYECEE